MKIQHVLFSLAIALVPACAVQGSARVHTGATVVYQEPPQPQVEKVNERAGYIWVKGHWNWQNGQWAWVGGHWEKERTGSQWREGRWERRGSSWHWISGEWIGGGSVVVNTNDDYPSQDPPAPQVENPGENRGHIWITGRWEWKGGRWVWQAGRWERARDDAHWVDGKWDKKGGRWVWVEGSWSREPKDEHGHGHGHGGGNVTVSVEYPNTAPPAPREEKLGYKPGHTWVKGRWEWKGGKWEWSDGRWEKTQAKKKWVDGRWEQQGTKWVWVDGSWQ
jgi:hypothetical protein